MEKLNLYSTGEFGFVDEIRTRIDKSGVKKHVVIGIGDDCAVVQYEEGRYVYTTDALVEGVHYNLEWSSWRDVIHKACVASLSDVNAMGAVPITFMVSLGLRREWGEEYRTTFIDAVHDICAEYGVELIGGDTVASPISFINIAMTGKLTGKPLLRSAAKAGQAVFVSGSLGNSAAGLELFQKAVSGYDVLKKSHTAPHYPVNLGKVLAESSDSVACMDISDGLSSELSHIAIQSGVKIRIYEDKIPVSEELQKLCADAQKDIRQYWLHGGEEYQLLFTVDSESKILDVLSDMNFVFTRIGDVIDGAGVELVKLDGYIETVEPGAYSHF